ncbi:MAG: flagellin N-terminal helical domain-containing protein [Planctomycetota bacterium]|jgi:flagellin
MATVNLSIGANAQGSLVNLSRISSAMNVSLKRLETGYRINTAADDPAGLHDAVEVGQQLSSAETAIKNNQASLTWMGGVDNAQQFIIEALQSIRSEVHSVVNEYDPIVQQAALSSVSSLLDTINQWASHPQINGRNVLAGGGEINLDGNATSLLDVSATKIRKATENSSLVLGFQQANAAEQAYLNVAYAGGPTQDTTYRVTTDEGSATLLLSTGATRDDAVTAFNTALATVGGSAVADGAANIILSTDDYGNDRSILVENISSPGVAGDNVFGAASVSDTAGVDGSVSINGQQYALTGDLSVAFSDLNISGRLQYDSALVGQNKSTGVNPASVSVRTSPSDGFYIHYGTGNSDFDSAYFGFQDLTAGALGVDRIINNSDVGYMLSNPEAALDIIDEALATAIQENVDLGVTMRDTLETSMEGLMNLSTQLSERKAQIMDADQAYESLRVAKGQMLQQATLAAMTTQINSQQMVLELLGGSAA